MSPLFARTIALRLAIVIIWCYWISVESSAQYVPSYGSGPSSSSPATQLATDLPSQRSGYAHSAMTLGTLHSQGYDDLAAFRPTTSPDGKYRKPKAIERLDDQSALICTIGGDFYHLDLRDGNLQSLPADATGRWSRLLKLDKQHVAAIDLAMEEVVIYRRETARLTTVAKLVTSGHPHSLAWDEQSRTLFVTGQWSQRLYRFVARDNFINWQALPVTDLPLHGGAIALLPANRSLIVTDAFGGDYVALRQSTDQHNGQMVLSNRSQLSAQNIPSLHVMENESWVLFPFQLLNPETFSVQGDITWGGLLSNNLRWLKADRMLTLQGEAVMQQSKFVPLGEVGNGAGDPNSLRFSLDGKFAVTLGGTDHVAVGQLNQAGIQQYPVGLHPVDSVFSNDGQALFVINEFSDSVSHIDLATGDVKNIPLGPLREPTLVERGERLFFHSILAHDGWMSCHSCHSQGHTSGQLNDNTSDGSLGTPKRTLSLLGQAETAPYSWSGEIAELEQQVLNSLQSTMATDHQIAKATVDAIAAYIRSLPAPPSVRAARGEELPAQRVAEGRALFERLSCSSCHAGKTLTSADRYDVNLPDERGRVDFNPPSLIGVSQRSRSLLHDGRATSIEDVLLKFRHQLPQEIDRREVQLLIDYLESL